MFSDKREGKYHLNYLNGREISITSVNLFAFQKDVKLEAF